MNITDEQIKNVIMSMTVDEKKICYELIKKLRSFSKQTINDDLKNWKVDEFILKFTKFPMERL